MEYILPKNCNLQLMDSLSLLLFRNSVLLVRNYRVQKINFCLKPKSQKNVGPDTEFTGTVADMVHI